MTLDQRDKDLLQEIKTLDSITLTRGADTSGVPFLTSIFRLHKLIFNEACSSCPGKIPEYINRLKKYQNTEIMSKEKSSSKSAKFQLKAGVVIPISGTSEAYSSHNITDENAIALLAANPNRKALFNKVPDNVDKLIANHIESIEVNESFDIDLNLAALEAAGVETKATTENGIKKRISELTAAQKKKFDEAMTVGASTEPRANTEASTEPGKTIEQLQFDLDKARQDFEELDDTASEADRQSAQTALDTAQTAFDAAQPK